MEYTVRFLPKNGNFIVQQVFEGSSETGLREDFKLRGDAIISIAHTKTVIKHRSNERIRPVDYALFCRELRTLLKAGMTVVEAVDTLSLNSNVLLPKKIYGLLSQGQSMSQALETMEGVPDVLLAAVRSGEQTSNLADSLADYLDYDSLMNGLRSKIISASVYPLIVSTLGMGIVLFLLTVVMPNFARMYQTLRASAKGLTHIVIVLSTFMNQYRLQVYLTIAFLIMLLSWWIFTGRAKQQILQATWAIAPLRAEMLHFQYAMLYQTIHLLMKGGYPVNTALRTASAAALNPVLKAHLIQAIEHIEQGKPISETLFTHQLCSEVDRRLLGAAERNGDFYNVAKVVSGLHREQFERFITRLTSVIEPVLLLLVAVMVGAVVVLMYLPVFELSSQIR